MNHAPAGQGLLGDDVAPRLGQSRGDGRGVTEHDPVAAEIPRHTLHGTPHGLQRGDPLPTGGLLHPQTPLVVRARRRGETTAWPRPLKGLPVHSDAPGAGLSHGQKQGLNVVPALAQRGQPRRLQLRQGAFAHAQQDRLGADLDDELGLQAADGRERVGEPHRAPQVIPPVERIFEAVEAHRPAAVIRHKHGLGLHKLEPRDDLGELQEHRVHERRVEGVAHGELHRPKSLGLERRQGLLQSAAGAGDHRLLRAVQRGDLDGAARPRQGRGDLSLTTPNRGHGATLGQSAHEPTARGDEAEAVLDAQHPGHHSGGVGPHAVPGDHVGAHTPRPPQRRQGHLEAEQRGLGDGREVEPGAGLGVFDLGE